LLLDSKYTKKQAGQTFMLSDMSPLLSRGGYAANVSQATGCKKATHLQK
jgi:hypothetical protein